MKLTPKQPTAIADGKHHQAVQAVHRYLFRASPKKCRKILRELQREYACTKVWSNEVTVNHKIAISEELYLLDTLLRKLRKIKA